MASRIFVRASSRVRPWLMHPGREGHSTNQKPPASRVMRTRNLRRGTVTVWVMSGSMPAKTRQGKRIPLDRRQGQPPGLPPRRGNPLGSGRSEAAGVAVSTLRGSGRKRHHRTSAVLALLASRRRVPSAGRAAVPDTIPVCAVWHGGAEWDPQQSLEGSNEGERNTGLVAGKVEDAVPQKDAVQTGHHGTVPPEGGERYLLRGILKRQGNGEAVHLIGDHKPGTVDGEVVKIVFDVMDPRERDLATNPTQSPPGPAVNRYDPSLSVHRDGPGIREQSRCGDKEMRPAVDVVFVPPHAGTECQEGNSNLVEAHVGGRTIGPEDTGTKVSSRERQSTTPRSRSSPLLQVDVTTARSRRRTATYSGNAPSPLSPRPRRRSSASNAARCSTRFGGRDA